MNNLNPNDGIRRLILDNALTIYTAADTKLVLSNVLNGAQELRLNLSAVEEVDCAGLQLLLAVCQEAQRQHISLHLEEASLAITELLQLSGLRGLLPFGEQHP
ncbi:STAS domain-containing protein [Pseudomonas protegens]|uniref:STAS domain-containing protein n=1 Tax=Pseudomonas protegens TaxID=380021 RepID=UPI0018EAEEA9|nr:STAS domain-containing protein [Pseudomonas protegens]MDP9529211.1 STAS domain-containing protein [Pseudomonas protegens]